MYETIKKNLPKAKVVRRFTGLGYKKCSVYRWLDVKENDKTFKRKKGSGRPTKIATKLMVAKHRAYFNHKSSQHVYLGECIKKRLEPKIKEYYQDDNYVFLPDLVSSHFANNFSPYLTNVSYVEN
ncbi:hypothetical protein BpHYR1_020255 [Brachionus plicatilis]|uniref:Uncharacterized protein n=1 Tax=Brachionus plicatilis TaxID=10195 RepID=A0A3M7QK07_BRAPC|nr:hypothetical protein BpHYR1_020255 [Brachionus plicatilis]